MNEFSDHEATGHILDSLGSLGVENLLDWMQDQPNLDIPFEFRPIINIMKTYMERILRASVLLGGWRNETQVKIRQNAFPMLTDFIFKELDLIRMNNIDQVALTDPQLLAEMLTNLLRIQGLFLLWIEYLYDKYLPDLDLAGVYHMIFKK